MVHEKSEKKDDTAVINRVHPRFVADRTIPRGILAGRFPCAIPGSSSSRGIYRRGTAAISRLVWRTLRDDNGQIYETAYRSPAKSNFRGRRSPSRRRGVSWPGTKSKSQSGRGISKMFDATVNWNLPRSRGIKRIGKGWSANGVVVA